MSQRLQAAIFGIFPSMEATIREEANKDLEHEEEQPEARGHFSEDQLHQKIISARQRWLASKQKTEKAAQFLEYIRSRERRWTLNQLVKQATRLVTDLTTTYCMLPT